MRSFLSALRAAISKAFREAQRCNVISISVWASIGAAVPAEVTVGPKRLICLSANRHGDYVVTDRESKVEDALSSFIDIEDIFQDKETMQVSRGG